MTRWAFETTCRHAGFKWVLYNSDCDLCLYTTAAKTTTVLLVGMSSLKEWAGPSDKTFLSSGRITFASENLAPGVLRAVTAKTAFRDKVEMREERRWPWRRRIHRHHLLDLTEQPVKRCTGYDDSCPGIGDITFWDPTNSQNLISWADGEARGILLRERKENVLLYIKQFNDDSMENAALNTHDFCSSSLKIIMFMVEPNTDAS